MHFNKFITFFSLLILFFLGFFIFNILKNNSKLSPHILFLTQPITSITGNVTEVGSDNFYLSKTYTNTSQKSKTLTYKVLVGENTAFFRPLPAFNSLPAVAQPLPKSSLQDVRVGQLVTVATAVDLRTLSKDEFEATQVQLPPIVTSISGKIVESGNGMVKVKGVLFNQLDPVAVIENQTSKIPAKEEIFAFQISGETKIVGLVKPDGLSPIGSNQKLPEPQKYLLSDLIIDQLITVYSDAEIIPSQTSHAVKIEVLK